MNINSRIKQLLKTSLVAIVVMTSGLSAMAQTFDASNITFGGINMPYRVAHTIGMGEPLLVIYLHGGTSKGNDNERQMGEPGIDSIANYIKQQQMEAYFLVPQCPSDKSWGGPMLSVLKALIDKYVKEGVADKNSVYIFGGSMGGTGTWDLALAYPDVFSRIAPMSGSVDTTPETLSILKNTPVWAFVGEDDVVVKPESSERLLAGLEQQNADARITVFPETDHVGVPQKAWLEHGSELLDWLLA